MSDALIFSVPRSARCALFPPPMKHLLAFLLLASSAFADGLKWERTTQRIEARQEDKSVKTEFSYRNTGKAPVRIESVRGVCV